MLLDWPHDYLQYDVEVFVIVSTIGTLQYKYTLFEPENSV